MYVIEANHLSKSFGEREIINIEKLNIEAGQRMGIVGVNGAGKTTLLKLLGKQIDPNAGQVRLNQPAVFWSQTEAPHIKEISSEMASRFRVPTTWREDLSGGEKTRFKAAVAFELPASIMLVDEPTTNLDIEGIEQLEQLFTSYKGTLLLISHDRQLLDTLCDHILEVEHGHMTLYKGNYSEYEVRKEAEMNRQHFEYDAYRKEKRRLKRAIQQTSEKSAGVKKTPSRMGNSEARLHKMGNQSAKKNLDQAANRLKTRLEKLRVEEKPLQLTPMQLEVEGEASLHKRNVVQVEDLNFGYCENTLFHKASFQLESNSRTALIGPNGSGKSTLIRLMLEDHPAVTLASNARVGHFDQQMKILDRERTILENLMTETRVPETEVRILLAKLLFPGDDAHKKVKVLSGGEQVKVSLGKILVQGFNLLILDEPTNHLDIPSIKGVEEALNAFRGTLLLVSHDRQLVNRVTDHLLLVENKKVISYPGNYDEYLQRRRKGFNPSGKGARQREEEQEKEEKLMVLENRKAHLIFRLSGPAPTDDVKVLDQEYEEVLKAIRVMWGQG